MPLIEDARERADRAQEKRQLLLRFLRDEIFTSPAVTAMVMGCGRRAAEQTVASMQRDGLVRRYRVKVLENLPATPIIGITHHGQAMAFFPEKGERADGRVFEYGRYSMLGLQHRLDIQRIRLSLMSKDFVHEWVPGDSLKSVAGEQRPDAVASLIDGSDIAIEVERTLKSQKRYRAVARGHFSAFLAGRWSGVVYVCPNQHMADRVRAMFTEPWRGHENEMTNQAKRYLNRVLFTTYENFTRDISLKFCYVIEGL